MRFLDALKEYLQGIERGVAHEHVARAEIDFPAARRHFLEALERCEVRDRARLNELWPPDDLVVTMTPLVSDNRFIERISSALRGGLCAGSAREELQRHVHLALDLLLNLPIEGTSRVRANELERVARQAQRSSEGQNPSIDIDRYAFESRLVRLGPGTSSLSPLGRVLLDLPEIDAVSWLLTLETQQSLGARDAWRMPFEVVEYLHENPRQSFNPEAVIGQDDDGDPIGDDWPHHGNAIDRLNELGVVERWHDPHDLCWGYAVKPAYLPVLADLAARKRTPLYVLAETLIADERDSLPTRALPSPLPQQSAAEIQARHARMVVHEIRNALVPVRLALGTLYESIDAAPSPESVTRSRERIDRGVERVFRFIDDMSRVAQLGVTAPSPFDAVEAIRDAIKGLNGGIQLDTSLTADDALPPVLGYRDRFTLAVVNLLRNAAQNSVKARAAVHLRAVLSASLDRVIVTVDDDGPGVPDESREDIFQQGFALRAGGSGQGLALVREVVEMEMKGQVRCERSELGGARFVLALPSAARETP